MTAYEKAGTSAVRVGEVDVASRSIDGRDIALDLTYTLQDEIGERGVLTLLDPEVLSIQRVSCDAATIAFARRDGHRVLDLTLQRARSFDGATIQMRVQWEEDTLERRNALLEDIQLWRKRNVSTLERAVEIAAQAHAGALDKSGMPYLLHPLRVMLNVSLPADRIAAVLHDVVEDTTVTLEDLRREGFSVEILEAVDALTKRKGETRMQSGRRAQSVPVARRVKLADVKDNMDLSRITHPTAADFTRIEEYVHVRDLLRDTVSESP